MDMAIFGWLLVIAFIILIIGIAVNISQSKDKNVKNPPEIKIVQPIKEIEPAIDSTDQVLHDRYELNFGGDIDGPIKPLSKMSPGMKECYECKSIIHVEALTCPNCGKDPSKAASIGKQLSNLGCQLTLLPVYIIILAVSGCCLWSIVSSAFTSK